MIAIPALGYALIASVALNAVAGWTYLSQRDTITTLKAMQDELEKTRASAKVCSDSVAALAKLAQERNAEAVEARKVTATRTGPLKKRADTSLAAPPAVPGNACASAQIRVDRWLRERNTP